MTGRGCSGSLRRFFRGGRGEVAARRGRQPEGAHTVDCRDAVGLRVR